VNVGPQFAGAHDRPMVFNDFRQDKRNARIVLNESSGALYANRGSQIRTWIGVGLKPLQGLLT
jgi:hypothetical protein